MSVVFFYKSGLTLLELVISVFILAILALLLAPTFHEIQAKQESKLINISLRNYIQHSKHSATLSKQDIMLCPSTDGETCSPINNWGKGIIMFKDSNKNRVFDTTEQKIDFIVLNLKYAELKWSGSRGSNFIIFKGDTGLPRGHIGHFTYCNMTNIENSYKTTLSMMGHVRHLPIKSC